MMYTSNKLALTLVLAAVMAVGISGIARQTLAQDAGNITGSVVVADEKNQVTILGQQGPPGPAGADGVGTQGPAGPAGADGKDGIVSFRCFDLNNVQINCPFVSVPVTQPPVVTPPPVANETGNVTAPPVANETAPPVANETAPPVVSNETGGIPEPTGNVTGGLNQNGTIVLGGNGEVPPATNETTTTTTTNTTVTTLPDGTTTTNSTSETVPADLNILSLLVPNFGI